MWGFLPVVAVAFGWYEVGEGGASHAFDGFVCASIGCVCRIAWEWGREGLRACAAASPVQPARRASHSVGSGSGRRRGWLVVEPAGWCRTSLSHDAGAGSIDEQDGSEAAAAAAARRRCRLVCVWLCRARRG